ncbi:MAG: serine/threonine-protein phosphatase, partial [Chrysiogenales bacterium]
YDVINMEGTDWVIIGDVSGHGVPAGIIMMMVHTSIRAILLGGTSKTPAELLGQVNAVITENVKMVGDDRYMTVTLMAFHENGDCTFTGLHQDILIYRSRAEEIEIVKSDGIWLGILEHTEGLITQKRIHMDRGDIMFLYTDGITEAWRKGSRRDRRDPQTDMYGIERLRDVFFENRDRGPAEIRDAVIASLDNYACVDDVTMVIIRKE